MVKIIKGLRKNRCFIRIESLEIEIDYVYLSLRYWCGMYLWLLSIYVDEIVRKVNGKNQGTENQWMWEIKKLLFTFCISLLLVIALVKLNGLDCKIFRLCFV